MVERSAERKTLEYSAKIEGTEESPDDDLLKEISTKLYEYCEYGTYQREETRRNAAKIQNLKYKLKTYGQAKDADNSSLYEQIKGILTNNNISKKKRLIREILKEVLELIPYLFYSQETPEDKYNFLLALAEYIEYVEQTKKQKRETEESEGEKEKEHEEGAKVSAETGQIKKIIRYFPEMATRRTASGKGYWEITTNKPKITLSGIYLHPRIPMLGEVIIEITKQEASIIFGDILGRPKKHTIKREKTEEGTDAYAYSESEEESGLNIPPEIINQPGMGEELLSRIITRLINLMDTQITQIQNGVEPQGLGEAGKLYQIFSALVKKIEEKDKPPRIKTLIEGVKRAMEQALGRLKHQVNTIRKPRETEGELRAEETQGQETEEEPRAEETGTIIGYSATMAESKYRLPLRELRNIDKIFAAEQGAFIAVKIAGEENDTTYLVIPRSQIEPFISKGEGGGEGEKEEGGEEEDTKEEGGEEEDTKEEKETGDVKVIVLRKEEKPKVITIPKEELPEFKNNPKEWFEAYENSNKDEPQEEPQDDQEEPQEPKKEQDDQEDQEEPNTDNT